MRCAVCNTIIDPERLEALPGTKTCTEHSKIKQNLTLMCQQHKTAAYVEIIDTNGRNAQENVRQAMRAFRRSR